MTDREPTKVFYRVCRRGMWFRLMRMEDYGSFGHGEYLPEHYRSYMDAKRECDRQNQALKGKT